MLKIRLKRDEITIYELKVDDFKSISSILDKHIKTSSLYNVWYTLSYENGADVRQTYTNPRTDSSYFRINFSIDSNEYELKINTKDYSLKESDLKYIVQILAMSERKVINEMKEEISDLKNSLCSVSDFLILDYHSNIKVKHQSLLKLIILKKMLVILISKFII